MKSRLNSTAILLVPLIFFLLGILTLSDYGVNWDNSMHYNRGHSYLHYFLTGETNYLNLAKKSFPDESVDFKDIRGKYMPLYSDAKKSEIINENSRRSYYQSDVFNFEYFKDKDSGHPPLNGILAALTNYIFFQKLGILGDLYSYQLFGIIAATTLILGVAIFTFYLFGVFPTLVAASSLALYPLFLGESHFNIKDPILASSFGLTIISFYFGIVRKKIEYIFLAAIFGGISLGTKFNALFLPFILCPWLLFYWWRIGKFKLDKKIVLVLLIAAVIPLLIFYITWPYLWFNGIDGLLRIFKYYAEEGTGATADLESFTIFGFNFFPIFWILVTTPIPILVFSLIGISWLISRLVKQKDHTAFLLLLWLFVPILRVTLPNTTIYGGVRHIMEFVPALAIAAGAGGYFLLKRFKKIKKSIVILITFVMLLVLFEIIKIHPNQNVYFNQLIGGLSGAKEKNIPFWGNSFGNAYQQGIVWLNKNAEANAKLGLPIGGTVNLPRENLRKDIDLHNDNFSAFSKKGEYQIEMTHDSLPKDAFTYAYLENFLNPVYEAKIDGVPILKVWKNDLNHTKLGFEKERNYEVKEIKTNKNQMIVELESKIYLTRLYMDYNKQNCSDSKDGSVSISQDGLNWKVLSDPVSYPQINSAQINAEDKDFVYLFAAEAAQFISINLSETNACMLNNSKIEIRGLEKLPD